MNKAHAATASFRARQVSVQLAVSGPQAVVAAAAAAASEAVAAAAAATAAYTAAQLAAAEPVEHAAQARRAPAAATWQLNEESRQASSRLFGASAKTQAALSASAMLVAALGATADEVGAAEKATALRRDAESWSGHAAAAQSALDALKGDVVALL